MTTSSTFIAMNGPVFKITQYENQFDIYRRKYDYGFFASPVSTTTNLILFKKYWNQYPDFFQLNDIITFYIDYGNFY